MNSKIKTFLLILIIAGVALMMPSLMGNTTKAADEAEWSDGGIVAFDGFTILEIMPYKGMGELGYLVDGQEPVDDELFTYNSGPGSFSHVQGAHKFFPSYKQKDIPANGTIDNGWIPAFTEVQKNGYFIYAGSGADLYDVSENQIVHERVANGAGTHQAILPVNAKLEWLDSNTWEPYTKQNVNAFFTDVIPGDTSLLFSQTVKYKVYGVTALDDQTGDYDYDAENDRFFLDLGNGSYDVIFEQSNNGAYFMLNDYEIVEDNSGVYSYTNIQYEEQVGGDYIRNEEGMTFTYQRYWEGEYRWVEDDTALSKANFSKETIGGVERIWVKGLKVPKRFQYTYRLGIVNNEWFKRYSLGIPSELANDYPVRVITLTPDELNANLNGEQNLIDEADLIYINADYNHDVLYIRLYENYSYEGLSLPYNQKYDSGQNSKENLLNFAKHDIDWTVADKIFQKIAGIGCSKAATIVDIGFYIQAVNGIGAYKSYQKNNVNIGVNYSDWDQDTGATSINMAKLYIMIYQRNKIDFYNSFMNPAITLAANRITPYTVSTNVSPTGSTASFVRPQGSYQPTSNFAMYWNGNTFLPWGLDAAGNMVQIPEADFESMGIYNQDMDKEMNDLTDNVLTLYGTNIGGRILGTRFTEGITVPGVDEDGDGHDDTIPIGEIGDIITGGGTGYGDTGGVSYPPGGDVEGEDDPEVVPDDPEVIPDDGSAGSNVRTYKRVLNIQPTAYFTLSETAIRSILSDYDVQIINMTSTQFNGSLEDINSTYDMIFMGSAIDSGVSYNRFNISGNKTDFNDDGLDTYIYLYSGDRMKITNDNGVEADVRYRNNDITAQKKSELIYFLEAGYPIVLDPYLYGLSYPDGRIMSNTNMHSFINDNKGYSNLLNLSNSSQNSFMDEIEAGFDITRPRITLISPLNSGSTPIDSDELVMEFMLYPWEGMRQYYKYNAYFYMDRDADGIFETTDKVNASSADGSTWEEISLSESTRMYTYRVPNLNGVYQWKLLVERSDNSNIRACITGYVSNTNKATINILHIRDNASTYNMKTKILDDTSSLINNLAGEGKLDQYSLKVDSMTVDQYEAQFTTAYDSSNPEATGKLTKYHLLILDNPKDAILNTKDEGTTGEVTTGAVTNIKDEIVRNLGVIYTKGALGYTRQKEYYSSVNYSFIDHDLVAANYTNTYNYINRNSLLTGYMMIYRDMIGENGADLRTDEAYKVIYLTKTNEGSIARYPYAIGKAINIADNSYSNDAVIDYDLSITPKQSLVGWYCLSDSNSPVVRDVFGLTGTSDTLYHGVYSSSPNDVKNNYYLFSNGTTFYSGINLALADQPGNTEEMKLFVNTIYAARKATESRTVTVPPIVEIKRPTSDSVIVTSTDLDGGDNYVVTFELTESLTDMEVEIEFGTILEPSGSWDDTIYEYSVDGSLGPAQQISLGKVFESGKTYAILVPKDVLNVNPQVLKITATNVSANTGTDSISIAFSQPPIVVIIDPVPGPSASVQYINVDIDYSTVAVDEDYLDSEPPLRVEFEVTNAMTPTVKLSFYSDSDSLMDGGDDDVMVYRMANGVQETNPISAGVEVLNDSTTTYALYIPAEFIKDRNIRNLKITAYDNNSPTTSGDVTVVILRRSLFPLD